MTTPAPKKASRTNAAWHAQQRMSAGATLDRRVAWHMEHATVCGCRPVPETIRTAMRDRGLTVPRRRR
jgi:hypothetical protein